MLLCFAGNEIVMKRIFAMWLLLVVAAWAPAQTLTIARVAQSGDTPPGSAVPFANAFANGFPAVHSPGTVSFVGNLSSVPSVYTGVGGGPLTLAVANGTVIPDGGGANFLDFGVSTGNGAGGVAFWGANATASPTLQGIYLTSGGTTTRVADTTLTAPGQATVFTGFSSAQMTAVNGTNVAFRGTFSGGSGLYARFGGSLVRVADTTTVIPNGTGNFTSLNSNQALNGNVAVFRGTGASSQQGVYLRDLSNGANPLLRVTDRTLNLPGTANLITTIFEPTISGNAISFIASAGTGTQRVVRYLWNGSNTTPAFTESVVTKTGDAVPEQGGLLFTGYQGFAPSDAGNLAVIGRFNNGADQTGIYFHDGTTLYRVIDTTQLLDNKGISSLLLGQDGVAGNTVTFQVLFTDNTQGIYSATFTPVPEPAGLLGLAGLVWWGRRYRRQSAAQRANPSSKLPVAV
jgi:hypothetical protein